LPALAFAYFYHMKWIILSILTCCTLVVVAQKNAAHAILQKVQTKLASMKRVSYHFSRETHYYGENYENFFSGAIYLDYEVSNSPVGFRFSASGEKTRFVYDGNMRLQINNESMTIDSATIRTAKGMQSNSFLYHSLAMLRNTIPLILANDDIQCSVTDTFINHLACFNIRIEGPQMLLDIFNGIQKVPGASIRWPYYLLVDKQTMLPCQFTLRYIRSAADNRDFVTVTYTNIDVNPEQPPVEIWAYSNYADRYKPYQPATKQPVIEKGAAMPGFTLPAYSATGIDSISLSQYKGKVILVDFWFKSCGPCMAAMPKYNDLQRKFGEEVFQLLTINITDSKEDVVFFYNKYLPTYKMLFNGDLLFDQLGFKGCPTSLLLDKEGKVIEVFYGFDETLIERHVSRILSGK
jgi:thiol-disulfide isomerase/thioredoxin